MMLPYAVSFEKKSTQSADQMWGNAGNMEWCRRARISDADQRG